MPNRRFGTANKFGTSNQFGASTNIPRLISFALEVDWDNDGLFDGYNEATERLLSFDERRGREFFFESDGQGFQHVSPGEIKFTLKNTDGRYNPYNSSGTLYSYLQGNQKVRFRVLDERTNTLYSDFVGYVDDIRPNFGKIDTITMTVKDGLKKLGDKNIRSSSVYTNVQYDDQVSAALTTVGWTDGTNIDTTVSDSMSYHWFRGNSALWEINQLTDAAFGLFFVDADGYATYKSHVSSDTSVMALGEGDIDYEYGIQSPAPREVIKNKITIYARARKLQTGVELWRMADVPQIATGTGSPIWANYSYNGEEVPATSVTDPVATTDYTTNAASDGSSTNLTANFSFTRTGFASSSKLVPVNSGAAGYITLLKIRGNAITPDNYTFSQDSDSASITNYGERELVIKSDWLQDINTTVDQVSLFKSLFKNPRFFPRVKIKTDSIPKQYTPDLFDLVTVNFPSKDISAEMRVGYMERSWSISDPNIINTIMYFEPNLFSSSGSSWIFPATFPAQFG